MMPGVMPSTLFAKMFVCHGLAEATRGTGLVARQTEYHPALELSCGQRCTLSARGPYPNSEL